MPVPIALIEVPAVRETHFETEKWDPCLNCGKCCYFATSLSGVPETKLNGVRRLRDDELEILGKWYDSGELATIRTINAIAFDPEGFMRLDADRMNYYERDRTPEDRYRWACPFLAHDQRCSIYPVRFKVCRDYQPYVDCIPTVN